VAASASHEPRLVDLADDEPDLVGVAGEDDLGAVAAALVAGDRVAVGVGPYLVGDPLDVLNPDALAAGLEARRARCLEQFAEERALVVVHDRRTRRVWMKVRNATNWRGRNATNRDDAASRRPARTGRKPKRLRDRPANWRRWQRT
jgi:hypothetical protein